jgi:type III secretion protein F
MTAGFGYSEIERTIGGAVDASEKKLSRSLSTGLNNTEDLIQVQMDLSRWSLTVTIQSTIIKELGDALKGNMQKSQ